MGQSKNVERLISSGVLEDNISLSDDDRASIDNMRLPDAHIDMLLKIKDQLGLTPLLSEDVKTILVLRRL